MPNMTFGPPVVARVREYVERPPVPSPAADAGSRGGATEREVLLGRGAFDCHMMISEVSFFSVLLSAFDKGSFSFYLISVFPSLHALAH